MEHNGMLRLAKQGKLCGEVAFRRLFLKSYHYTPSVAWNSWSRFIHIQWSKQFHVFFSNIVFLFCDWKISLMLKIGHAFSRSDTKNSGWGRYTSRWPGWTKMTFLVDDVEVKELQDIHARNCSWDMFDLYSGIESKVKHSKTMSL